MKIKEFAHNVSIETTIALWVCLLITLGLGIGGFLCPPMGEIHKSVLQFGTIVFGMALLFIIREAIKEGMDIKLKHKDTEVEINND